jgi:hypothetical protein
MPRHCLGLGAILSILNLLLSLSCYKLVCHYLLHLLSTLCTHTCHISYILILCSTDKKMKSCLMKIFSRRAGPRSTACGMVSFSAV